MRSEVLTYDRVRAAAICRRRNLEFLTIGWNSLEAVIAIVDGAVAGSIALVGFGYYIFLKHKD